MDNNAHLEGLMLGKKRMSGLKPTGFDQAPKSVLWIAIVAGLSCTFKERKGPLGTERQRDQVNCKIGICARVQLATRCSVKEGWRTSRVVVDDAHMLQLACRILQKTLLTEDIIKSCRSI